MQIIKRELKEGLDMIDREMRSFPWGDSEKYGAWLSQTYYYVCHSTRLLCLSGARFDQADNRFHLRAIEHMSEEKSHEAMALKDLRDLGYSIDHFSELSLTQALYQTVYYAIEHKDPVSIYGYILCLEGVAVRCAKRSAEAVKSSYVGKRVHLFLDVHGEDDPDHLDKALEILKDLSPSRLEVVRQLMSTSFFFYREMLRACSRFEIVRSDIDFKRA